MKRQTLALLVSLITAAAQASESEQDLTDLDLATLMSMDVTVTSASRREQSAADAAAAVYVVTREDIQRSGATSIPEALRLAPGIEVARIDSRGWAVSARGFNHRFANKLLVMVDGRSIYTALFSGVFWDEEWLSLEQVERIEIVRGPGGALWGINAVNGVINIITRKASDSAGLHAHAGSGSLETLSAGVSYGGQTQALGHYEVHVNRSEQDALQSNDEALSHTQFGFRIERPLENGAFSLQSDYTHSDFGDTKPSASLSLDEQADVGNVTASYERELSSGSIDVQSYYAWTERSTPVRWDDSAMGLDLQFNAKRLGRHVITAGAGYVLIKDEFTPSSEAAFTVSPAEMDQHQWSIYGQDEVHFLDDAVRVILGAKLEDLRFTGLAFQPTLRTLWHATERQTLWAAASRAARTPSRAERHGQLPLGSVVDGVPTIVQINGNANLKAEDMHAYELGWRWRPYQSLSLDVSAYHNEYEHLVGQQIRGVQIVYDPVPTVVIATDIISASGSEVNGLELASEWMPLSWLRLNAQAAFQDNESKADELTQGVVDPKRMFTLRAQIDLPAQVKLDLGWRAVSALTGLNVNGYDSANARLAWEPVTGLELSFSVDNMFDNEHVEFSDDLRLTSGAVIGRTFFARATWQPRR